MEAKSSGHKLLATLGLVKGLQRKHSSTTSIYSVDAFSSGILPALGSRANLSTRNIVLNKRVIHPYNRRYRYLSISINLSTTHSTLTYIYCHNILMNYIPEVATM
jgi:hypothetical protein